jgi:cell wall-associated NlpC family hydrolase
LVIAASATREMSRMRNTSPVAAMVLGLVVAVPVLVVTVFAGGAVKSTAAASLYGGGLRPESVPAKYEQLVLQAGSLCAAAPPAIIAAQIQQESSWNPRAVSSAGAQGISQFLPSTWAAVAPKGTSPFDPTVAIIMQGKYDCGLAAELSPDRINGMFGGLDLTSLMLAAYNAGSGAVRAARGIPQNGQTPGYVSSILSMAAAKFAATSMPMAAGSFAAREIAAARSQLGEQYCWDAGTPTGPSHGAGGAGCGPGVVGFDCSGLVLYAVAQASGGKIVLAHSADQQTRGGQSVPLSAMQPGDIISFTYPGDIAAHHVGIYVGNNEIINAPDFGEQVRIDSLDGYKGQSLRVARYGS